MILSFLITAALLLIVLIGKLTLAQKFKNKVLIVRQNTLNESFKIQSVSQITALPKPVQRYFKYVLKQEMPYQNLIKLKHKGMFRANLMKGFTRISGVEYFSASTPQFIWKGTTMLFTAIDSFISDIGNLKVLLFNVFYCCR